MAGRSARANDADLKAMGRYTTKAQYRSRSERDPLSRICRISLMTRRRMCSRGRSARPKSESNRSLEPTATEKEWRRLETVRQWRRRTPRYTAFGALSTRAQGLSPGHVGHIPEDRKCSKIKQLRGGGRSQREPVSRLTSGRRCGQEPKFPVFRGLTGLLADLGDGHRHKNGEFVRHSRGLPPIGIFAEQGI